MTKMLLKKMHALTPIDEEIRIHFWRYQMIEKNMFSLTKGIELEDFFADQLEELYEIEYEAFQTLKFSISQLEYLMNILENQKDYQFESVISKEPYFDWQYRKYFLLLTSYLNQLSYRPKQIPFHQERYFKGVLLFELMNNIFDAMPEIPNEHQFHLAIKANCNILYLGWEVLNDSDYLREYLKEPSLHQEYNEWKEEVLKNSIKDTLQKLNRLSPERFQAFLNNYPTYMSLATKMYTISTPLKDLITDEVSMPSKEKDLQQVYQRVRTMKIDQD